MQRAIELARRGRFTTTPNPNVGCVLVHGAQVVGEGWHVAPGGAHAEVMALRQAGDGARGSTAYVTLEPCNHHGRTPPCTAALIDAGVARVVGAMSDPNPDVAGNGYARLRAAGIEVETGLCDDLASELNHGYLKRARKGLPWVRVKLASSFDGRTAMASGESKWITGEGARADVQLLRASSCCVLTGSETVLSDDPGMNVRLTPAELNLETPLRQPLRAVADSRLRTPAGARILRAPGRVVLFCEQGVPRPDGLPESAEAVSISGQRSRLDLAQMLRTLSERFDVHELHVEAGAALSGALLEIGVVDEIVCYVAPVLMGSQARPLVQLPIERMADRRRWRFHEVTRLGEDLRVVLRPGAVAGSQSQTESI